jgi:polyisoprenoid-binding protein YceI
MAKYEIDRAHSEIRFKVKHMMITNVSGEFLSFRGNMESNEADFSDADIYFEADVTSVTTNNERRDDHVRSSDFFDALNHPQLTFASTSLEKVGEDEYKLHGELCIRGIAHDVTLDVEYGGSVRDSAGNDKLGFELRGVINRNEFNLNWNALTEAGGLIVSEEVRLILSVQMVKV